MKLKKHIETFEKSLNESTAGTAGITGHYGRGAGEGKKVDDIFAGGFEATDSLKGDLTRQFNKRKTQRKELGLDDEQAPPFGGYHDIETPELIATYQYWDTVLDAKIKFNDEMTPKSDPTWYLVDKENWKELINKRINYDNNNIESKKAFINSSGDSMEEVDIEALEINYDKVIDKTEENKKFINDSNDWKSIYDSKKY